MNRVVLNAGNGGGDSDAEIPLGMCRKIRKIVSDATTERDPDTGEFVEGALPSIRVVLVTDTADFIANRKAAKNSGRRGEDLFISLHTNELVGTVDDEGTEFDTAGEDLGGGMVRALEHAYEVMGQVVPEPEEGEEKPEWQDREILIPRKFSKMRRNYADSALMECQLIHHPDITDFMLPSFNRKMMVEALVKRILDHFA